jgi:hypothetical protein
VVRQRLVVRRAGIDGLYPVESASNDALTAVKPSGCAPRLPDVVQQPHFMLIEHETRKRSAGLRVRNVLNLDDAVITAN